MVGGGTAGRSLNQLRANSRRARGSDGGSRGRPCKSRRGDKMHQARQQCRPRVRRSERVVSDGSNYALPAGGPQLPCWDLAGRDVVPELAPRGAADDSGAAVLYAMLRADGAPWEPPYRRVRELMQVRRKALEPERESRPKLWTESLPLFRGLGFVYERGHTLRVTPSWSSAGGGHVKHVRRSGRRRVGRRERQPLEDCTTRSASPVLISAQTSADRARVSTRYRHLPCLGHLEVDAVARRSHPLGRGRSRTHTLPQDDGP